MSEPFLGQIKIIGCNFAPRGWAMCDGQILPINTYQSLYSLLGTNFGGDGRTSFALPDLRGRVPVFGGNQSGQTIPLAGRGGEAAHTLVPAELPSHGHTAAASNAPASLGEPSGGYWAASPENGYGTIADPAIVPAPGALSGGVPQAHDNMQPYLPMNVIIAIQGLFPSRN